MTNLIEDTGNRRRATDGVSTDESLNLISTLAFEYALQNPDVDILEVENAIIKCRELKVDPTGKYPTLKGA
jgi:hypothetical protein